MLPVIIELLNGAVEDPWDVFTEPEVVEAATFLEEAGARKINKV